MNVGQGGDETESSSVRNGAWLFQGGGRGANTNTSTTALKMSFRRSNNHDRVRRVVAAEEGGRAAGNFTTAGSGVPPKNRENNREEEEWSIKGSNSSRAQKTNPGIHKIRKPNAWAEGKSTNGGALPDKVAERRSPTKDRQQPRKTDQQPPSNYAVRYKNLKQDIEEMYAACDADQSAERCIEVLKLMSTGVRDFEALRDRILRLHEKAEKTDAPDRPNPLSERKSIPQAAQQTDTSPKAASERKSSPPGAQQTDASPKAAGTTNFVGGLPSTPAAPHLSHTTGPSWADRVKSSPPSLPVPVTGNAYPAKPPSAAAVVTKVNPVVVVSKSKDTPTSKDNRPHYEAQQRVQQLPGPQGDNVSRVHPLSGQPAVPVELASSQAAGHSDRGRVTEPLRERVVQDAGHFCAGGASHSDTPSRSSAPPTPPQASCAPAPTSAPMTAPVTPPVTALSPSPDQPRMDGTLTPHSAQGDGGSGAVGDATTSVPGQAEAAPVVTAGTVSDSTEFLTPEPEVLPAKKEDIAVCLDWPDEEDAVGGTVPEEDQLTMEIQAEHNDLERKNEEAIASAIAEEEQLTRQIQAENDYLERADNEEDIALEDQLTADIQTGDTETDNESDCSTSVVSVGGCDGLNMDWNDIVRDYEAREPWRQSMSWGDIVEMEPSRPPGHGIYMHEKFSNPPSRRSSTIAASKKKCEERQLNAEQNREKIREEKTLHLQKLHDRHTEVRRYREALLEERRRIMEEKHSKAEFKRELHLHAIVKKAQEEDAKVKEIEVINMMEAQNKRHDARVKQNEYEQRRMDQQEERHRRQEEKQARDRAVQERKRVLEATRQAKLDEMLARRKEQELRIEQQKQEKGRAREDAARERARDQEVRLDALRAAQQEATEDLRKKSQIKSDGSSRRHMEQLEQRKKKAAELSCGISSGGGRLHANVDHPPKLTPYERRKRCTLCEADIASDVHLLAHTKGRRHQQAVRDNSSIQGRELSEDEVEHLSLRKYIVEVAAADTASILSGSAKGREERQKAKKKAKKLRAKMNSRSKESETAAAAEANKAQQVPDSPFKGKLERLAKDVAKQLQAKDGQQQRVIDDALSGVNRNLWEISRILEKRHSADQVAFQQAGGFSALELILKFIITVSTPAVAAPSVPLKSLSDAVNAYYLACSGCAPNCSYNLFSNKISLLMDLLLHQLKLYVPGGEDTTPGCPRSVNPEVFENGLITGLLQTSATILGLLGPPGDYGLPDDKAKSAAAAESFNAHARDVISYAVSTGLIDKLSGCFLSIQGPVDECPNVAAFLQQASALLHNMCILCFAVAGCTSSGIFGDKRRDPTGLSAVLRATDLVGVVHALYCVLLHGPQAESSSAAARIYPPSVAQVALQGIRFVNSCALLDLSAVQSVLGAEGLSLAFHHIVGSLLAHCSSQEFSSCCEELLNEVIICVGYFAVHNPDNQAMIAQSGPQPSVLQQLCQFPFKYFSQPCLMKVLFPSLIAACHNNPENKSVLQQEMSCMLLATFIQDCTSGEQQQGKAKQGDEANRTSHFCELSNRFPRDQWDSALHFFQQK